MNPDTHVTSWEVPSNRSRLPARGFARLNCHDKRSCGLADHRDPPPAARPLPSAKLTRFLARTKIDTPFLVVELNLVAEKYSSMRHMLPDAVISYAVKANPEREILDCLRKLGASFDVASVPEMMSCLAAGAAPECLSYGNTIKKAQDIVRAYALGVRMFGVDRLRLFSVQAPRGAD
jgi:hypothetical protein